MVLRSKLPNSVSRFFVMSRISILWPAPFPSHIEASATTACDLDEGTGRHSFEFRDHPARHRAKHKRLRPDGLRKEVAVATLDAEQETLDAHPAILTDRGRSPRQPSPESRVLTERPQLTI